MPFKTPEAKLARNRRWRRSRSPGYHAWLYQRRKLRFDKAAAFEAVLRAIADGSAGAMEAGDVLVEMEERERRLGNEFDHDLDQGVWVG